MHSDTSVATAGIKACCACGTDVAGQPRMKDSHGRYWCVPCGEADQKRKAVTSTTAHCAGCHKEFSKGKLDKHGEHWFCKGCWKKRSKAQQHGTRVMAGTTSAVPAPPAFAGAAVAAGDGGSAADRKRVLLMAAILIFLVLISVLFNFVWAG
jgi:hypothetical protein